MAPWWPRSGPARRDYKLVRPYLNSLYTLLFSYSPVFVPLITSTTHPSNRPSRNLLMMSDHIHTLRKRLRESNAQLLIPGEVPKTPSTIKREGYTRIPSQPLMKAPFMSRKARNPSPIRRVPETPRKPRVLLTCTPDQDHLLSPRKQRDDMAVSPVKPRKSAGRTDDMEVSPIRRTSTGSGGMLSNRASKFGQEERPRLAAGGDRRIFPTQARPQPTSAPISISTATASGPASQGTQATANNATTTLKATTQGKEQELLFLPDSDDESDDDGLF